MFIFIVFEEYFHDCSFVHTCQIIVFVYSNDDFLIPEQCVCVCLCMHALMTDVVVVMCLQYY